MIALNVRNSSISIQYYSLNTEIVVMQNNNHSQGNAEHMVYVSPVCDELFAGAQMVICASETEKVTEEEGEW